MAIARASAFGIKLALMSTVSDGRGFKDELCILDVIINEALQQRVWGREM